ncbi:uncharacterized protein LOC144751880 [Ciona intestinalis]
MNPIEAVDASQEEYVPEDMEIQSHVENNGGVDGLNEEATSLEHGICNLPVDKPCQALPTVHSLAQSMRRSQRIRESSSGKSSKQTNKHWRVKFLRKEDQRFGDCHDVELDSNNKKRLRKKRKGDMEAQEDMGETSLLEAWKEVVQSNTESVEGSVNPSQSDADNISYQIIERATIRGKPKLFDNVGYSYTLRRSANSFKVWECSIRGVTTRCSATVKQKGSTFVPGRLVHNHPPKPGLDVASKIKRDVKRKRQSNPLASSREILRKCLQEHLPVDKPCPALPSIDALTHLMNSHRQANRPVEPTDSVDFELLHKHLPKKFLKKDILKVGSCRHLIFATNKQIRLLKKAEVWYVDASFKHVKMPFVQMLSIHCFIQKNGEIKQVPLVFALMSRNTKKDYQLVLRAVVKMIRGQFCCSTIVMDFEEDMWRAVQQVMPYVEIKGCAYHYTQAVGKEIKALGLHGKSGLNVNNMYKLISLCYLPAMHIPAIFKQFGTTAKTEKTKLLIEYFKETWMDHPVWGPTSWSVYNMVTRGKNDVGGWCERLNKVGKRQSSFYVFVHLLRSEAKSHLHNAKLMSQNKLRKRQRKMLEGGQRKIYKYWKKYEAGCWSANKLLGACSKLTKL